MSWLEPFEKARQQANINAVMSCRCDIEYIQNTSSTKNTITQWVMQYEKSISSNPDGSVVFGKTVLPKDYWLMRVEDHWFVVKDQPFRK